MNFFKTSILLMLLSVPLLSLAQGKRQDVFVDKLTSDTIHLSQNTVMPSSVVIYVESDTIKNYILKNNMLIIHPDIFNTYKGKTIRISFNTFNENFETPFRLLDTTSISVHDGPMPDGFVYITDRKSRKNIIDAGRLNYSGSFSRGFSVGNAQSLVLNSNFDMQLQGDLGSGLKIVAAISDANLPIQVQGNTQQLQEFDKVFIQVSKDRTAVIAGDYELTRPSSYFSNYYKKAQGIQLQNTSNLSKNTTIQTSGSFAISRGKFARQTLPTKEGNQGPYRLTGNNNERFIIVLSGTEKIYFNGKLLTRGYDHDYTINYNNAEVIFSPTQLIARDSRVIIEFEYTDLSYLRSLYTLKSTIQGKNYSSTFSFYNEQDSKQAVGDVSLDSIDIQRMEESGDDLSKNVRVSIRAIKPDDLMGNTAIYYRGMSDPNNPELPILIYTSDPDSAQYIATFTEVGSLKGDYIIDNTLNINGRVYKYVGRNNGSYLPIISLIPPEKKQLITYNFNIQPKKDMKVYGEVAFSNLDKNRFSSIDGGDDKGLGGHIQIQQKFKMKKTSLWEFDIKADYEMAQKTFNPLNPYRPAEFLRDWNVQNLASTLGDEHIFSGGINAKYGKSLQFSFFENLYQKGNFYKGSKHEGTFDVNTKRLKSKIQISVLNADDRQNNITTTFIRPNGHVQFQVLDKDKLIIGGEMESEKNASLLNISDSLSGNSLYFLRSLVFAETKWNEAFSTKISYGSREDKLPFHGDLVDATTARDFIVSGRWSKTDRIQLGWHFTSRDFILHNQEVLVGEQSKKTLLGRLDFQYISKNKSIRYTNAYNASSGQEPKLEYAFKEIENGQGEYVYIGASTTPNLQNIQDFRYDPSNPLARYFRFSLPNNEFISTNNVEFIQSLSIDMSKIYFPQEGKPLSNTKKFIARISTLSNIQLSKRLHGNNNEPSLATYLDFSLADSTLVAFNTLQSHTLFFNRGHVKFDMQLTYRIRENRIVQITGAEDNGGDDINGRIRYGISKGFDAIFNFETGTKTYASETFTTRNYNIQYFTLKPEINFRPNGKVRIGINYGYTQKQQTIYNMEAATLHNITTEFSWRAIQKWTFDLSSSYVKIAFDGEKNSFLEYDMLDGLKKGANVLWNLRMTKRMSNNIDLSFQYDGRKPGENPIIHTGRVQAKATF